jgi:hypothetical protein
MMNDSALLCKSVLSVISDEIAASTIEILNAITDEDVLLHIQRRIAINRENYRPIEEVYSELVDAERGVNGSGSNPDSANYRTTNLERGEGCSKRSRISKTGSCGLDTSDDETDWSNTVKKT